MNSINTASFTELQHAILQTVAYADVFDYPLSSVEIHRYLTGVRASREEVDQVLQEGNLIPQNAGFYMLPDREGLAAMRQGRERIAAQMWPQAIHYGRLIADLPFVRMVAVTGSLAMNNADQDPDIDYLIVTAPGRLWMVRALALGIARAAATQGVRLCPNYLISENSLVFPDQTLYAAHELAQMVPLSGLDVYEQINNLNLWKERFLPNAVGVPPVRIQMTAHNQPPAIKTILERALGTPLGAWFEGWEMRRKVRRLTREQSNSPESFFARDYCKGHNLRHGQRTEQILRKRLAELRLESPV
jgi:hypothetical protein